MEPDCDTRTRTNLRTELIQVAAVACSMVEMIERINHYEETVSRAD